MSAAIIIENLGKQYLLHHQKQQRHVSFREVITDSVRSLGRRAISPFGGGLNVEDETRELFWALKDIDCSIEHGDRFGIIGRNGSGKSTLLKILSRITEPTVGRVTINGRVSSLLEVGTGFHPELTGRENIFLNGSILGMSLTEIRSKFDEIVAFAETEKFLDTPVKFYSSGMYVRLAFSVAAHLEPEILIIDEVLAVGDAQFQKKCMGKMEEVGKGGRTVLFVSHSMAAVTSLCNKCLLLENGRIKGVGDPKDMTTLYFTSGTTGPGSSLNFDDPANRPGNDIARLHSARVINERGERVDQVNIDQKVGIEMVYEILQDGYRPVPNVHLFTQGQQAFASGQPNTPTAPKGIYRSVMWIPGKLLNEGIHVAGIAVSSMNPIGAHFHEQEALRFNVIDDLDDPRRNGYTLAIPGIVRPNLDWSTETLRG